MSEKRFKKGINLSCVDTETGKSYWYACNLCGLLNEQQATIEQLEKDKAILKERLRESEMRLGEFRTKTKDCENKLKINLSVYDDIKHNADGYIELDIDMVTDNVIYLRPIENKKE